MNFKNLLLGSITAAGVMTGAAYAADLGVLSSLDVCDQLGVSGLTISSDTNCLKISGEVSYNFSYGVWDTVEDGHDGSFAFYVPAGQVAWGYDDSDGDASILNSEVEAKLNFEATAGSSFGLAKATLKLVADYVGYGKGSSDVAVDEAYVSIGEGTILMAGHKGSVFNYGDDEPLNWLGLFNASAVDNGVLADNWSNTGTSNSIQVSTDLGNGFSLAGGLEQLEDNGIAVGVLAYKGEDISAHVSVSLDNMLEGDDQGYWYVHSGIAATLDSIKLVAALSTDANSNWNVLGSASATFDMFTIAGSVEADHDEDAGLDYTGAGVSLTADVSEGVKLNIGGRWSDYDSDISYEVAVGAEAALAEDLTLSGAIGYVSEEDSYDTTFTYGWAKLAWAPGGGFTASVKGTATYVVSDGADQADSDFGYKVEAEFKKTFE